MARQIKTFESLSLQRTNERISMKIKILLTIAIMIVLSVPTFAQEAEKVDLRFESYKYRKDLIQLDDNILSALLKVPFEKRVYVYPALFESEDTSRKITTHPQIAMWKGKKPTKIAPRMQKFAQEYLDTMPAKFYPYLDPDNWPEDPKTDDWHNVASMLPKTIVRPTNEMPPIPQTTTK